MSKEHVTPSQILAINLIRVRAERNRSQRSLAEDMRIVGGHKWTDVTVSNVERNERTVSVDELGALALILGSSPSELLAPPPPPYEGLAPFTDVSIGSVPIPRNLFAAWLEGFGSLRYDADKLTYDNELAMEFFTREGLFAKPDEKSD